jgi:glutathionylspermidine synthase
MLRISCEPRAGWQQLAAEYGFHFHTLYDEPYWDESAYYQFSLAQIEHDLERPTEELHEMCLQVVERVVRSEELLRKCQIPPLFWQQIADSWQRRDPSLYSRLDLVYDGTQPAKLLENNADTPTSLFESGFWQWLWLEAKVASGVLPAAADQFNSLQDKLIARFAAIAAHYQIEAMHFSCCQDSAEDRGTVQYLQDCALEAGLRSKFVFIEDIGLGNNGAFTDLDDQVIAHAFKLYPWEYMQREKFADAIANAHTRWLEPMWKAVLSNKALLPLLWDMFPGHPNLLPAWFEADLGKATEQRLVKKPLFSREGANISILDNSNSKDNNVLAHADGPYGEEGYVYQAFCALPRFGEHYTLIGSWLVDDTAAGISIREDSGLITQNLSRYLPHIIM